MMTAKHINWDVDASIEDRQSQRDRYGVGSTIPRNMNQIARIVGGGASTGRICEFLIDRRRTLSHNFCQFVALFQRTAAVHRFDEGPKTLNGKPIACSEEYKDAK